MPSLRRVMGPSSSFLFSLYNFNKLYKRYVDLDVFNESEISGNPAGKFHLHLVTLKYGGLRKKAIMTDKVSLRI